MRSSVRKGGKLENACSGHGGCTFIKKCVYYKGLDGELD